MRRSGLVFLPCQRRITASVPQPSIHLGLKSLSLSKAVSKLAEGFRSCCRDPGAALPSSMPRAPVPVGPGSGQCQLGQGARAGTGRFPPALLSPCPVWGNDEFGRPQWDDDAFQGTYSPLSQRVGTSCRWLGLGPAQAWALAASLVLSPAAVQAGAGNTIKNSVMYGNEPANSYCVCFA